MNLTGIDLSQLEADLIRFRRERHAKPENAWNEYLTTCAVVQELQALGLPCLLGRSIHTTGARWGLPTEAEQSAAVQRALDEGAAPALVQQMAGGRTGVVAILDTGRPGPVTALRFDLDCNEVDECPASCHRPAREGFASQHPGLMHACGHDAHAAIGIGVARILAACRDQLRGTVKLVFQPAEEGCRGAASLADSGILDDVDYLFGGHVWGEYGTVSASIQHFSTSCKVDLLFEGVPAHAGAAPEKGRNALVAAAAATLNLLAIPRHSSGYSRVNVGVCQAGTGRNVIPGSAVLKAEVRGQAGEICDYLMERALAVCRGAADMYGCTFTHRIMGRSVDAPMDQALMDVALAAAGDVPEITAAVPAFDAQGAGEDVTFLLRRVQSHGGQGTFLGLGASQTAPNHNGKFDIDERILLTGAKLFAQMVSRPNGREA